MAGALVTFKDNHSISDYLVRTNHIGNPEIEQAFHVVDRANYFLPEDRGQAYNMAAYKNGNIHISSPQIYALVMKHLELGLNLSFLNIGSGTGYLSTLVGLIIGSHGVNHGVEIHQDVIDFANQILNESRTKIPSLNFLEFCEPVFIKGNGLSLRCSLYDRVYSSAACPTESENYMKNLIKVGGVLVMPLHDQLVQITRTSEKQWEKMNITGAKFASLQLPTALELLTPIQLPAVNIQLSPQINPNVSLRSTSLLTTKHSTSEKMNNRQDSNLFLSFSSSDEDFMNVIEIGMEAASESSCTSTNRSCNVTKNSVKEITDKKDKLLESLQKVTQRLEEFMECPVCFGTLDSTVVQCKNGHGICSACAKRIDKCPECREEFVVHHSTLLKKIIECLPKTCVYADQGCSVIILDEDHEKFCKFRPSVCRNALCGWSGCAKDIMQHVKTCVKNKICEISTNAIESRCFIIDKIQNMFFYSPIIYHNELFWECLYRDVTTKRLVYRFYHVATSEPTHTYYFKVSFRKGKIEFTNSFRAFFDIESDKTFIGDETGLIFPDCELRRFQSPKGNGKYDYSIEVVTEELA